MQSIYDKQITASAYVFYLQGMRQIFERLEAAAALEVLPACLLDPVLNRVPAITQDLSDLSVAPMNGNSVALDRYLNELMSVQHSNRNQMTCHHFLQYNAVLSGGAFLGSCLRQMGMPTALYQFELRNQAGEKMYSHQYVNDYMKRLDVCFDDPAEHDDMVNTMIAIYELTELLMDEAQSMQPTVIRAPQRVIASSPDAFSALIPFTQLRANNGINESKVYISIGGRVLDATGSASYAPGGPYHVFAGHEISRALSEMSLDETDLDDLDFECDQASSWATKLGRCYAPVGTLAEFTVEKLLPTELFCYDCDAPKLERSSDEPMQATQKCPLTGQEGVACPLGFGSDGKESSECPFPFIFLHDPARGWELHEAQAKVMGSLLVLVVCVVLHSYLV